MYENIYCNFYEEERWACDGKDGDGKWMVDNPSANHFDDFQKKIFAQNF